MSKSSDQPEFDAVDEALTRADLPRRYHGIVDGVDVEVVATIGQEAPLVVVSALERTGPYDNLLPTAEHAIAAQTAIAAADQARELAERHDLEVIEA